MNKKLLIWVLLANLFVGCTSTYYTRNVTAVTSDAETITLRCTGFGIDEHNAIADAERYGIETIFFRGIPDTQQNTPLIGTDEKAIKEQYANYFAELFDKGRYRTFIVSSVITSGTTKTRGENKTVTIDVRVNLKTLRTDLERVGIIRKFGY